MTSRQGRQAIAATAAMGVAVALALPTAAFAQSATQGKETATTTSSGTTYYVSSAHGDDANAGTSENAPWKSLTKVNDIASDLGPGDSVLLEYGSEFNDQYLHIKDTAGNADAPITISAYGDADEGKPVIASNGVKGSQWEQDYRANVGNHKNKGTVSTTLLLKDVSYITVSTWRSPTTTRTSTIRSTRGSGPTPLIPTAQNSTAAPRAWTAPAWPASPRTARR